MHDQHLNLAKMAVDGYREERLQWAKRRRLFRQEEKSHRVAFSRLVALGRRRLGYGRPKAKPKKQITTRSMVEPPTIINL